MVRRARFPRTLGVVVMFVLAATALTAVPASAAPPNNDYFANATDAYYGILDQLSTTEATVQSGEPTADCTSGSGHTVWYRFIPSQDDYVNANTFGSSYDTVLTVYEGTQLNSLSFVDCNDDSGGSTSSLDFNVYYGNTYYIQVAGYGSASGTLNFSFDVATPDYSAPTVTKPVPSVHVGSKLGSGSSRITWSGYDSQSGISYYELQKSQNGGSWQNVGLPSDTATSISISLSLNTSVQFRVRATDNASNTSAWRIGPSFTPVLYEDRSPAVTYSGLWTRSTDPNSSGGTHTWTRTSGARVSLRFTGRTVAFIAPTDYHRGRADVIVDGVLMATVDLYSVRARERVVLFSEDWNTVGNHTIVIRNKGTAGRPKIDLDTFLVYQ